MNDYIGHILTTPITVITCPYPGGSLSDSAFSLTVVRASTREIGETERALGMWKDLLVRRHNDTAQLVTTIRDGLQDIQRSKQSARWLH